MEERYVIIRMKESSAEEIVSTSRITIFLSEEKLKRANNKDKEEIQRRIDKYTDIYESTQDAITICRRRLRDQYVFNFYDLRKAE
jgi:hypothetical protein